MGFEMHLCILTLIANKLYVTKILTMKIPSNSSNFSEELMGLVNRLLELVSICETIKKQACRGKKRKSMDDIVNGSACKKQSEKQCTNVIWDKIMFDDEEEEEDSEDSTEGEEEEEISEEESAEEDDDEDDDEG